MRLPKIGDTVTSGDALKLCLHFGFTALACRIITNPGAYKDWTFDGASMLPDWIFSRVFRIPNLTEISLRHDLKYVYGEAGNATEKLKADLEFRLEVLDDGASPLLAKLMFAFVDIFGIGSFKEWD